MKTIKLNFQKSNNPINYSQLQTLKEYDNFSFTCSSSQLFKRLSVSEFEEIIEHLNNGIDVEIID